MDEYDRLWGMRQNALGRGDVNLAAEIEMHMKAQGFTVADIPLDDTPAMKERTVSHKTPSKRQR